MERGVMVFIVLLGLACNNIKDGADNVSNTVKQVFTPPIAGLNPATDTYYVNTKEDREISTVGGTSIRIPKEAFVNADGELVTGAVELKFRAFKDAFDVFLAGYPMEYKLDDKIESFETAGMFEIYASMEGEELFINPEKKIRIDIPSQNEADDFRVFKVNDEMEWQYAGEGKLIDKGINTKLDSIERRKKVTPFPLTENYFVLNYLSIYDLALSGTPREKKEVMDKLVAGKMKDYGFKKFDFYNRDGITFGGKTYPTELMLWEEIGKKIPEKFRSKSRSKFTRITGNKYRVVLTLKDETFETYVNAVIPLAHLFKMKAKEWEHKYDEYIVELKQEEERLLAESRVIRSLEIDGFGIYNWDRFVKYDNHVQILASYNFEYNLDGMFTQTIYCITKNDKALVKLQYKDRLMLTPEEPAKLFTVMPNGELMVYPLTKFNTIDFEKMRQVQDPTHHFEFTFASNLKNAQDVRNAFGS